MYDDGYKNVTNDVNDALSQGYAKLFNKVIYNKERYYQAFKRAMKWVVHGLLSPCE